MIDPDRYEEFENAMNEGRIERVHCLWALAEIKRLRNGVRNILSDYDITDLIREVDEEDWNFEQQALVRMKELIE